MENFDTMKIILTPAARYFRHDGYEETYLPAERQ